MLSSGSDECQSGADPLRSPRRAITPPLEQLGAEIEALQKEAADLLDQEAMLDHLSPLRELTVYLNVHLIAPRMPEA